jgi:hypothetical protein
MDMTSLSILTLLLALRRSDIKFCNPLACDDIVSYGGTMQSLDRWLGMNKKHDPSLECLPSAVLLTLRHKVALLVRRRVGGRANLVVVRRLFSTSVSHETEFVVQSEVITSYLTLYGNSGIQTLNFESQVTYNKPLSIFFAFTTIENCSLQFVHYPAFSH